MKYDARGQENALNMLELRVGHLAATARLLAESFDAPALQSEVAHGIAAQLDVIADAVNALATSLRC